ncbi:MAG: ABC transporter substrate-binding protein [Synergistes sp.]|nr:ABC transporter substrate-binding protein [Synergistes sp.]
MPQTMKSVIIELVVDYGIDILEDTDRLSQFLEDRCPDQVEDVFHLSFALRYLLKRGWHPSANGAVIGENEKKKLCENLGLTPEDTDKIAELINSAISAILRSESGESENTDSEKFVARPGNLKRVNGGLSGHPKLYRLKKKNWSSGFIVLMLLAMIVLLVFQICTQRTPDGDELCVAFFAPMSGEDAKGSYVQLKAAQLAVEKVNSRGVAGEYKLKVVGFDLPRERDEAVSAVSDVMSNKHFLAMIIGTEHAPIKSLSKLADKIEAPLIVAPRRSLPLSEIHDETMPYSYTFSVVSDLNDTAKMMAYFTTQAILGKRPAIYYSADDVRSAMLAKSLRKWSVNFGAEIAAELSYKKENGVDHNAAMKSVAESGADVLLLPGINDDKTDVIDAARACGFRNYIVSEGYTNDMCDDTESSMYGTWWLDEISPLDPSVLSVLNAYVGLYNEECPQNEISGALTAYDAVMWIASALENSPGFRGEAVRHTLLSTKNLPLTHATLTVDPRTHAPLNKAVSLVLCAKQKGIFQRRIRINKEQ